MSHQDPIVHTGPAAHHQDLKGVLDWLLASADLSGVRFRDDCTWTPRALIGVALLWAWSGEAALTERFDVGPQDRHPGRRAQDARRRRPTRPSSRCCGPGRPCWRWRWCRPCGGGCEEDLADRFLVAGFAVFGVDGSRLELPRTESNEAHFAPTAKRPKAQAEGGQGAVAARRTPPAPRPPAPRRRTARRCG